ncbi:MAG TPA: dihydroneopterin aldolase [Nevskiaceae bacterium]|nr:dihydroneopterin aldolase [Nevskiaceae bacterium]
MDTIFVTGLQVQALVGVHAHERLAPRPLVFDLEMDYDLRPSAASDALRDTLDYAAVCAGIEALCAERQPLLIETLAEQVARMLFARFPLLGLRLTLHKPGAVAGTASLGVRIERRREDYAVCGR